MLICAAPLMALIAIIIKLETPGPAIFSQERVGFLGKRFMVYDFAPCGRTRSEKPVQPGPEKRRPDHPCGSLLRKARLDELPQVWNVLRGDMSFIGPRPERPYFVDLLTARFDITTCGTT